MSGTPKAAALPPNPRGIWKVWEAGEVLVRRTDAAYGPGMTPAGILETVLYADDLAVAEAFWTGVFGLKVVRRLDGKFVFFRCGDGMLLIFDPAESARPDPKNPIPRHGATGPGHVCFAASAAELDAWADHLRVAGIGIEAEHTWPGGGRSLYLRDPAGNSIELAEPRIWA